MLMTIVQHVSWTWQRLGDFVYHLTTQASLADWNEFSGFFMYLWKTVVVAINLGLEILVLSALTAFEVLQYLYLLLPKEFRWREKLSIAEAGIITVICFIFIPSYIVYLLVNICLRKTSREWLQSSTKEKNSITEIFNLAKTAYIVGNMDKVVAMLPDVIKDINYKLEPSGLTLLLCACLSGEKKLVMYLLKKGADLHVKTHDGDSALYFATFGVLNSEKPDITLLQEIIRRGCDVNVQNDKGYTPLHRAASKGNLDVIKCLLSYGADLEQKTVAGAYPIDVATNAGHIIAEELLKIDVSDKHTILEVADPHTPPHIRLGLTKDQFGSFPAISGSSLQRKSIKRDLLEKYLNAHYDLDGIAKTVNHEKGGGDGPRVGQLAQDPINETYNMMHLQSRNDKESSLGPQRNGNTQHIEQGDGVYLVHYNKNKNYKENMESSKNHNISQNMGSEELNVSNQNGQEEVIRESCIQYQNENEANQNV